MEPMSIFWLAVMIVMLAVEAATANLVSIWFAGGALAAFIAAMCDGSIPLQIILFIALSGLLLLCLWPLRKKLLRREKPLRANADRVIGMTAVVTEAVDNIKETGARQGRRQGLDRPQHRRLPPGPRRPRQSAAHRGRQADCGKSAGGSPLSAL